MEREFWISQLGRLYGEVHDQGIEPIGANAYAEQFNEVLENLKEEFPDNDFVQSTEEVSPRIRLKSQADAIKEVQTKCGQLADALGYDLPHDQLARSEHEADIGVVQVVQKQTANQSVSQDVSFEQTMEMINYISRSEPTKEELRDLVKQYEEELEDESPDESRLRDLLNQAKERSPDVAANLAMKALERGFISILGL